MNGSHAGGTWQKLLEILKNLNKEFKISSIADIASGLAPIELDKIDELSNIKEIYRLDGHDKYSLDDTRQYFNANNKWPLKNKQVDLAFGAEIIEHTENPWHFIREMIRITKVGFIISKPNTDKKGLDSRWYGENQFFHNGTLFDGSPRWEHINFIPNYELKKIAEYYNLEYKELSTFDDDIQFFQFIKKISLDIKTCKLI